MARNPFSRVETYLATHFFAFCVHSYGYGPIHRFIKARTLASCLKVGNLIVTEASVCFYARGHWRRVLVDLVTCWYGLIETSHVFHLKNCQVVQDFVKSTLGKLTTNQLIARWRLEADKISQGFPNKIGVSEASKVTVICCENIDLAHKEKDLINSHPSKILNHVGHCRLLVSTQPWQAKGPGILFGQRYTRRQMLIPWHVGSCAHLQTESLERRIRIQASRRFQLIKIQSRSNILRELAFSFVMMEVEKRTLLHQNRALEAPIPLHSHHYRVKGISLKERFWVDVVSPK